MIADIDHDVLAALIGAFALILVAVIPFLVRRSVTASNGACAAAEAALELVQVVEARILLVQEAVENLSGEVDGIGRKLTEHLEATAPLVEFVHTLMGKGEA